MKRKSSWLLISGVCFTIWGCEAFSPHPEFVARVGIHEMPVTNLADLFVHGEALRVNRRVADEMVRHWIDVALVAGMAAGGDSLMSEEFITEFMWPDIRGFQIAEFKERLYAENVNVDSAVVDSVFWRSDVRFLAHILRGVRLEDGPEVRATQRANAEAMHSALLQGAGWNEVNQNNQDERAKAANGALGLVARGATPERFENVAFALGPGEMSGVVETRAGYHIIYRPRLEEVWDEFSLGVEMMLRSAFDSVFSERLLDEYSVAVGEDSPKRIREVLLNPYRAFGSDEPLAEYAGGIFTVDGFVKWLQLLTPEISDQMLSSPDEDVITATERLVLQELIWAKADSAGIVPTDSMMALVGERYRAALNGVWNWANISPDSLSQSAPNVLDRERIALIRVQDYMEGVAARRIPGQTVPPFLAAYLRALAPWEINQAGMQRALERAVQRRAALQN